MFLCSILEELNHHFILSNLWDLSDHTLLLVHIIIKGEFILEKKLAIIKNIKEEKAFVNNLITRLGNIDMTNIHNQETLEEIIGKFASITEELWYEHAKQVYIIKHFKTWQNKECSRILFLYWEYSKKDWIGSNTRILSN